MNIAYRFLVYPTEEQKILLGKTFGCCRFLYNQMLNDKIQEYKKTKKMLKNTPAMYKKAYPFLKEVDSLALANVQLHLEKAYKNFFRDPKVGFPVESRTGLYSSDSTPFADQGVPALSFARDASRNVAPIHCRYDLKEVLSMEQLQKDINFLTTFTKRFANAAICPVSRTIPEKIRKELDEYLYRKRKEE